MAVPPGAHRVRARHGPPGFDGRPVPALHPFLAACRRQPTAFTPVWLMRQAGRYLPEYRAIREKLGFLELCRKPDVAAEVTVLPVEKLGVDAAILFADILLLVEPLGVGLEFARGEGPVIRRPVRSAADVERLVERDPAETVPFVFETVRRARAALRTGVPLIGFAGAPFTVASYLVEGGARGTTSRRSGSCTAIRGAWHALLEPARADDRALPERADRRGRAGRPALRLLGGRARAGRLPHVRAALHAGARRGRSRPACPSSTSAPGPAGLLGALREAGGDVIGLDWRVDLGAAWRRLGTTSRSRGTSIRRRCSRRPPRSGGGRRQSSRRPPAGRATSSTSATACCPAPPSTTSGRSSTPSTSCPSGEPSGGSCRGSDHWEPGPPAACRPLGGRRGGARSSICR